MPRRIGQFLRRQTRILKKKVDNHQGANKLRRNPGNVERKTGR